MASDLKKETTINEITEKMEKAEKIRPEDISIGDWFQARIAKWDYEDLDITPPMRVVQIGYDEVKLELNGVEHYSFVEDLAPIPITREILVKNGWRPPR